MSYSSNSFTALFTLIIFCSAPIASHAWDVRLFDDEPRIFAADAVVDTGWGADRKEKTLDAVTIGFWLKTTHSIYRYQRLFSNRPYQTAGGTELELNTQTGLLKIDAAMGQLNSADWDEPMTPYTINRWGWVDTRWHHWVVVFNQQQARIYINGARKAIFEMTAPFQLTGDSLLIGGMHQAPGEARYANLWAEMYDFRLIEAALTPEVVREWYAGSKEEWMQEDGDHALEIPLKLGIKGENEAATAVPPSEHFQTIIARHRQMMIEGTKEVFPLEWERHLSQSGLFRDLDYRDPSFAQWEPYVHLGRLKDAFSILARDGFGDRARLERYLHSFRAYLELDPVGENWWHNEIGTPKQIVDILTLLGDELEPLTRGKALQKAGRVMLKGGHDTFTGQNLVWRSQVELIAGSIEGNAHRVGLAAKSIASTIEVTTEEGIQPDYSFHQHGAQLYNHGYGASFHVDVTDAIQLLEGTPWEFPKEKTEIVIDYLLEGSSYMAWNGFRDPAAMGRNIARPKATSFPSHRNLPKVASILAGMDSERSEILEQIGEKLAGNAKSDVRTRFFWRADALFAQRPDWYFSVKMASTRTIVHETGNMENLQGGHLSFGTTLFMTKGDEWSEVFPLWNWRRVPGTTTAFDPSRPGMAHPYESGKTELVGGLTFGSDAVAAHDFSYEGLRARKAWFVTDEGVWCVGSGITGKMDEPINTSLFQEWQTADLSIDDRTYSLDEEVSNKVKASVIRYEGKLLAFTEPTEVNLEAKWKSQGWDTITSAYPGKYEEGRIVSAWIDHGMTAQNADYCYYLTPDKGKASDVAAKLKNSTWLMREPSGFAMLDQDRMRLFGAFFESGRLETPHGVLEWDAPCNIILDLNEGEIAIAEPTQKLSALTVIWNGKSSRVTLPEGPAAGSTVKARLETAD
jgi:chondroitin AC lyase